jgi:hypothetical protein
MEKQIEIKPDEKKFFNLEGKTLRIKSIKKGVFITSDMLIIKRSFITQVGLFEVDGEKIALPKIRPTIIYPALLFCNENKLCPLNYSFGFCDFVEVFNKSKNSIIISYIID